MKKMQSAKHNSFHFYFLTTKTFLVILGCLFLFLSFFIPYSQKLKNTEQLIAKTEIAMISTVRASEIRYQAVNNAISRLTYLDYPSEKNSWIGDAQFLENSFEEIEYISWIDKNFLIKDIVPIVENEIFLNKNPSSVQLKSSSINQWFSVHDRNTFQGFILSSINLTKLIQPFESTFLDGFMIQVLKNGDVIYYSSNWERPHSKFIATRTLTLQESVDISFNCSPTNESIQAIQNYFYTTIAMFIMIFALILFTIFFAQKYYFFSKMNESRYRNLLDDANLLALILNTNGIITYCNDFFLASTGWKRQEILGTKFSQRFITLDNKKINQFFLNATAMGDIPIHIELPLITKSGETRLIRFNNTLQRNEKGLIIGFSALGEDITEQKKSAESLHKQYEFLKTLFSIDQAITSRDHISKTFCYILDQVNLQLDADASSILLFHKDSQSLEYEEGRGFKSLEIQQTSIPIGTGLTGKAALEQTAGSTYNLQNSKTGFSRKNMAIKEGFNWYHVEPLVVKNKINGVLEVYFKGKNKPDDNWYSCIKGIAQQTALVIDNSTLFTDLEKLNKELLISYDSTLEGWSRALEMRDTETKNHSLRVTEMTLKVCSLCEMSKKELIDVHRGALLHDIGKMGIPDNILLKKEKLSDSDWAAIRKHPQYAYELLYPIKYLRSALDIPYCHHEKWDGSGYPRGLKGEEIPLPARIFAVVDVWDALLSDRPYRKGWPKDKVIEEIKRLSGNHFDPEAVKLFLKVYEVME
jgi:PAS domain S-box-containing protein